MATVRISNECARGCGYRKGGGLYLVSNGPSRNCGKMPIPCETCPCCGEGIKPARGWTWVDGDMLMAGRQCATPNECAGCRLAKEIGRVGLLWVGESFYPTPEDYMQEAVSMGISRRISGVPRGFKVGETWVFLGHRKVVDDPEFYGDPEKRRPGIFQVFCPKAIEYVVKGTETEEELDDLEKRGFSLVKVVRVGEQSQLDEDNGEF